MIEWDMNGNKIKEEYYRCSLYHRTTGPAIIEWYSNGVKKQETEKKPKDFNEISDQVKTVNFSIKM